MKLTYVYDRSPKATLFSIIYAIILFVVGFWINNEMEKEMIIYWDKMVEIKQEDSVNIKVMTKYSTRGYYCFNDSLFIIGAKIDKPVSLYFDKIYDKLGLPFYLKKDANNDTIWLIDYKAKQFVVFRSIDLKEDELDVSWREFFERLKNYELFRFVVN